MNRRPNKIVVLLGDPKMPDSSKPGGGFTEDDIFQVEKLKSALGEINHLKFEYWDDHRVWIDRLQQDRPELVVNFCDTGWRNDAKRELHIPALLEILEIPYTGSGPVALGLCYDKAFVRAVAQASGVPVPKEILLSPQDPLPEFEYPAFLKPNRGDGSVGISRDAIVNNVDAAAQRLAELRIELPSTDILLQEFLSGEEYGLGMIGNVGQQISALPTMRIDYDALDPALPRLLDYSSKVDPTSPYWHDIRFPAAELGNTEQQLLEAWCETLFARLGLRDYARFDFRADNRGQLKLMEVNPNPAWCWDGKFAHMGELAGLSHSDVLGSILNAAMDRCFGEAK